MHRCSICISLTVIALSLPTVVRAQVSGEASGSLNIRVHGEASTEDSSSSTQATPSGPVDVESSTPDGWARVSEARTIGDYAGVVPGRNNPPPAARRIAQDRRIMTWPGFQMMSDGHGRFFLQTNQPVEVLSRAEQGRFVVLLKDTRIHLRNNRRPLDTRFFDVPVGRAFVERRGDDLAFVLELRAEMQPNVATQSEPTGHYIFVDFPSWTPPAEPVSASASATSPQPQP